MSTSASDRNIEAVGHFHQPHRLAVAFRHGHAEIVLEPALGVGALFLAEHADALALEAAEAADDGVVLAEFAVAGERHEVGDQGRDIVERVRALRVARHLRLLPGGEGGIKFLQRLGRLGLQPVDFLADGDRIAGLAERAQFLDLGLQFGHRLFEVEIAADVSSEHGSNICAIGAEVTQATAFSQANG